MEQNDNGIQRLKTAFSRKGLPYKLIERDEFAAVYSVGGIYYPLNCHFETIKIKQVARNEVFGRICPAREVLPSDEEFGKEGSKLFSNKFEAIRYLKILSRRVQENKLKGAEDHNKAGNSGKVDNDATEAPIQ